jgi:hypothetical protein
VTVEPPLSEFVAAGWFIVQPLVPAPDRAAIYLPNDIVPSPVLTISPCLATMLPEPRGVRGGVVRARVRELRGWGS